MKIDRHNYEEFFILYWDEELIASQKQAVENFVKENADLQEEFRILGETRFTPDKNVQLEEKEFLLNKSFINITNYEEQLLNYIDDELSVDERKEIKRSAAKYPTIQKELALLQKTKLQPEGEVIFPDKSTLYRREENADSYRHRVLSMTWFRVAVAAAIILIAGFVTLRLVNTNKSGDAPPVAKVDESKDQPSNNKTEEAIAQPKDQSQKDKEQALAAIDDKSTREQKEKKKSVKENNIVKPLIAYEAKNKNNLPKEGKTNNQTVTDPNPIAGEDVVYNISKDNNRAEKSDKPKIGNPIVTLQPGYALNLQEPDDRIVSQKEKVGLKEFLRKTTRVFERRTKIQATTEDNKLLVGAFAVSLK